jgi:hypothetical protein
MALRMGEGIALPEELATLPDVIGKHQPVGKPPTDIRAPINRSLRPRTRQLPAPVHDDLDGRGGPVPHRRDVSSAGEVELPADQTGKERNMRPELIEHDVTDRRNLLNPDPRIPRRHVMKQPELNITELIRPATNNNADTGATRNPLGADATIDSVGTGTTRNPVRADTAIDAVGTGVTRNAVSPGTTRNAVSVGAIGNTGVGLGGVGEFVSGCCGVGSGDEGAVHEGGVEAGVGTTYFPDPVDQPQLFKPLCHFRRFPGFRLVATVTHLSLRPSPSPLLCNTTCSFSSGTARNGDPPTTTAGDEW